MDLSGVDEAEQLGKGHEHDFEALVFVGRGQAGSESFGEEDLHPLREEAGAGVVADELRPLSGAEAGLFGQLAFGGGEAIFVGIDFAGGDFVEELPGGVAVLAFEDDEGVTLACVVYGEDDDRASVPDDVADDGSAVGLADVLLLDAEERASVGGGAGDDGRGLAWAEGELAFDDLDVGGRGGRILLRFSGGHAGALFSYGNIRLVMRREASVAVIGAGNWGGSLVAALRRADVGPVEVVRRGGWAKARLDARVIWVCVPDGAIAEAAQRLAKRARELRGANGLRGQVVAHSSGALTAELLEPARQAGAKIAAVHPVMSFPTRRVVPLAGVMFGVEAKDAAVQRELHALVRRLGGVPFAVKAETKALYHAAGVMASPLLVAELTAAMETARLAGLDEKASAKWVQALAEASIRNVFARGPERSFSGPFARGDAGTIHLHLQAMEKHPVLADVYRALGRYAVARLPVKKRSELNEALRERTT